MRTIALLLALTLPVLAQAASYLRTDAVVVDPILDTSLAVHPYSGPNLPPGANLFDADLAYAYLPDANLNNANLSEAYLYSAFLSGANLSGANLGHVDFQFATLNFADLTGAERIGKISSVFSTAGKYVYDKQTQIEA